MKAKSKFDNPPRISREDLRKSRMGLLGRFPEVSRFEPEGPTEESSDERSSALRAVPHARSRR